MQTANFKISTRLGAGFGIVMLLAALMGVAGIWRLQAAGIVTNTMVKHTFVKERLVTEWYDDAKLNGTRTLAMAKITNPSDRRELGEIIQNTHLHDSAIQKQLNAMPKSPAEDAALAEITAKRDDYVAVREDILETIRNGDEGNTKKLTDFRLDPALDKYLAAILKLSDLQAANISISTSNVAAQFGESQILLGALTGLVLLVSVGFTFWISQSITMPLRKAIKVAQTVALGDLSGQIDVRGIDEVSQLMQALKAMNDSLARIIGQLHTSHARIDKLAYRDALTGLPNRQLARDRFEQAIALAGRNNKSVALLFLDLDDFKSINDSLGHASGDLLLRDVAGRLTNAVRTSDTVSRQGGDEFLVVMGGAEDESDAAAAALKIIDLLATPFQMNGMELSLTCSMGIVMFPADGNDFETLLKNADIAMYRAKESGRNAFRFYDAGMDSNAIEHLHLISRIRIALAKQEFKLHYQPQYDLRTGRIIGAEALLRWRHPELGMISPAKFIPAAESSGLIHELGRWVLNEACRQTKAWQEAGLTQLVVAINLSPVQFRRDDIERDIMNALAAADLAPSSIELELTESLLIADSHNLTALLGRLRAMGIRLSIDDFGTGYSNLGYLKQFKVACLKIDQSFVRRLTENSDDAGIVRAIIEMAHSLKLEVVAEGVENLATLMRLTELGCELGQGYHWSPALPADDFFRFVNDSAPANIVNT
jgi:diguanylate cyclase (GGDEF)-like protein